MKVVSKKFKIVKATNIQNINFQTKHFTKKCLVHLAFIPTRVLNNEFLI